MAVASPVRRGPLTWAQAEWLLCRPDYSETSFEENFYTGLRLPRALAVGAAREAVGDVLRRHENLRSRVERVGPQALEQVVDGVEAIEEGCAELFEAVAPEHGRQAAEAAWRTCFRGSTQWPVKVVALAEGGATARLGLVVDHWAADAWALNILKQDLGRALAARAEGTAWRPDDAVEQPVDVAAWERSSARGAARARAASEYWRERLGRLGRDLEGFDPVLPGQGEAGPEARFRSCWLSTHRGLRAARAAAGIWHVPVSAVFLAAFAAAICAVEQAPSAGVFMLSANRLSAPARRSVRKAVMHAPVVLADPGRTGLAAAAADAARQQLRGHRFANADPVETERLIAESLGALRYAGATFARFNYMNDNSVGAELASRLGDRDPAGDGVVHFTEPKLEGPKYMLSVNETGDRAVLTLRWRDDTGWHPVAQDLIRHIEDLVLCAADTGAAPAMFGARR
jgi:hypothetical protein